MYKPQQGGLLPYYWKNGKIQNHEDHGVPTVPTFSQAMDYSVVIIEGIRVNVTSSGKCFGFRLRDHVIRMLDGWRAIHFKSPFSEGKIFKGLCDCIETNLRYLKNNGGLQSLYIRPKIYVGDGAIKPLGSSKTDVIIECFPLGNYISSSGVTATLGDFLRTYRYSDYTTKGAGKYVEYGMLRDSVKGKYDDVLQLGLGDKGRLIFTEATTSNIFFVKDKILLTPRVDDFILKGITRDSVIKMAQFLEIPVQETQVPLSLIFECDELFLTGTASFITPIVKIGRFSLPPGPITKKLSAFFKKVREGRISKFRSWLTPFKNF